MACQHPRLPLWRICGAGLGVLAIVLQVLLTGLMVVQSVGVADADEFSVICSHDGAPAADVDSGKSGPGGSGQHHCPACGCPQHGTLFSPPPASGVVLAVARAAPVPVAPPLMLPVRGSISPYASRAPPRPV